MNNGKTFVETFIKIVQQFYNSIPDKAKADFIGELSKTNGKIVKALYKKTVKEELIEPTKDPESEKLSTKVSKMIWMLTEGVIGLDEVKKRSEYRPEYRLEYQREQKIGQINFNNAKETNNKSKKEKDQEVIPNNLVKIDQGLKPDIPKMEGVFGLVKKIYGIHDNKPNEGIKANSREKSFVQGHHEQKNLYLTKSNDGHKL